MCKMEFAGVKSECLRCFISSHPRPAFSSLARPAMNDSSSLAADYSARYHWYSVPLPFRFRLLSRRDKNVRLVKLVVAVYEFFGQRISRKLNLPEQMDAIPWLPLYVPLQETAIREKKRGTGRRIARFLEKYDYFFIIKLKKQNIERITLTIFKNDTHFRRKEFSADV